MKKPAQGGLFHFLAEWTGLAYLPQAAAALASAALLVPPEAEQAASLRSAVTRPAAGANRTHKQQCPHKAGIVVCLAERTGLEPATPGVTGRYSNRLNYRSLVWLNQETGGC